jgi:hypothetical protein
MANRHKAQSKSGGRQQIYGNSKVFAAASEKTHPKAIMRKDGGKVDKTSAPGRMDKRARGGRAGADKSPYSSACLKGG